MPARGHSPPRLDISSAELQGRYEPSGERWRKEKVIREEDVAQTCENFTFSIVSGYFFPMSLPTSSLLLLSQPNMQSLAVFLPFPFCH